MRRTSTAGKLVHELTLRLDRAGETDALAVMHESHLTLPQIVALHMLESRGPSAVSTIAAHLRMSMSATSTIVQRLVDDMLVTRTEDPKDRRQKRIALTRKGAALVDRVTFERTSALARGIATLPAGLRAEIIDVIRRVVAHLREQP